MQWLDIDENRATDLEIERVRLQSLAQSENSEKTDVVGNDRKYALEGRLHMPSYGNDDFSSHGRHHNLPYHFSPQTTPTPYSYAPQYWSPNYINSRTRLPNHNEVPIQHQSVPVTASWNNSQFHGQYLYQQYWQGHQPHSQYDPYQRQNSDSQRSPIYPDNMDPSHQEFYPRENHSQQFD